MTEPVRPVGDGLLDTEPVVALLTGLAGIVDLGIIAANALEWVYLTDGQTAAIVAFITGVTGAVAAALRSKVWAPASVAKLPCPPSSGPVI